jgi:hypothetical protein
MRRRNRSRRYINWIEKYCVIPSGQRVKLSAVQKEIIRRLYDDDEALGVAGPLAAYLTLLHVCGPEAVQPWPTPPKYEADIFTVWAATGPDLRAVLQRHGEVIVCPELNTRYPTAA